MPKTIQAKIGVTLLIVGVLGVACWYIYQYNNDESSTVSESQTQTAQNYGYQTERAPENNEEFKPIALTNPTELLEPYTLPDGWSDTECHEAYIALIPPETEDPVCESNQPNTVVTIYTAENYVEIDPEDCTATKSKRDTNHNSIESYKCSEVIINGKKGIREVVEENEQGFSGEAIYTSYVFPVGDELLYVLYADIEDNNYPNYLSQFDEFVNTLQFKR